MRIRQSKRAVNRRQNCRALTALFNELNASAEERFEELGGGDVVADCAELLWRVHGKERDADVACSDAERCGEHRTDRAAAAVVGVRRETLERNVVFFAEGGKFSHRFGLGGIALVPGGFEDDALAEFDRRRAVGVLGE